MSITSSMHGTATEPTRASADSEAATAWLSIRQGNDEMTVFGKAEHIEKFRMAADILNDAFAREPEPAPAETPADKDDLPF